MARKFWGEKTNLFIAILSTDIVVIKLCGLTFLSHENINFLVVRHYL